MTIEPMNLSRDHLDEITSVIEDTVQYACDQWMIPGPTLWTVVDALAESKLREFAKTEILS